MSLVLSNYNFKVIHTQGSRSGAICLMDENQELQVTAVVDTGLYGIVRHPQYLGCMVMMLASVLVSQHWLSAVIGLPIALWLYSEMPAEDEGLILKFGEEYRSYMERVPSLNIAAGMLGYYKRESSK